MTKKTKVASSSNYRACDGCGRHKRFVREDVKAYFCSHCFTMNGNYNRYKAGIPTFKPLEGIRVKDILIGADGLEYKVLNRGEHLGEDTFYPVVRMGDKKKEVIFLGDFFFVRKA